MSKKLLNETAVRRFMGLAGMQANTVSSTINEMYPTEAEEENVLQQEVAEEEPVEDIPPEEEAADAPDEMPEPALEPEPEAEAADGELEITSEEADVLATVLEKLLAARDVDPADEMPAEDELADPVEELPLEDAEALSEVEVELSEDEIVQEVARRVAKRILKAKKAQNELNQALGK